MKKSRIFRAVYKLANGQVNTRCVSAYDFTAAFNKFRKEFPEVELIEMLELY